MAKTVSTLEMNPMTLSLTLSMLRAPGRRQTTGDSRNRQGISPTTRSPSWRIACNTGSVMAFPIRAPT